LKGFLYVYLFNDSKNQKSIDKVSNYIHSSYARVAFRCSNYFQISECGKANTKRGRIVGGDIVPPHKYPWMAAMFKGTYMNFNCGGSVITDSHVITAGEKFRDKFASIDDFPLQVIASLSEFESHSGSTD
jgi:secreted trypsin-like serine protease